MEIQGEDGTKIILKKGSEISFGRGDGVTSDDRTVSRRHVSFQLYEDEIPTTNPNSGTKVRFESIGKNPIWVRDCKSGEIRVFRRFETGELVPGDGFCVSARKPAWFTLKMKEDEDEEEEGDTVLEKHNDFADGEMLLRGDEDLGFELVDVSESEIDPVKEFGFLVIGHEFDHYPKHKIRGIKNWDWFLQEPRKDNEDDKVPKMKARKRKSDELGEDDNDDWTGESEDDKELIAKLKHVSRPNYRSTRSKDHNKTHKATRTSSGNRTVNENEDDSGVEDEDTLGGFIVNDDDVEQEGMDEDEEEEFDDEEEEDDQ